MIDVHVFHSAPSPHPLTPGDYAIPSSVVAEEPPEQAEALARIKVSDRLAEWAGVDPEALEAIKRQEWREGANERR